MTFLLCDLHSALDLQIKIVSQFVKILHFTGAKSLKTLTINLNLLKIPTQK